MQVEVDHQAGRLQIDPHAHVDFWANPLALTPHLLASGTTAAMADPHDIVGAVGLVGLELLIEITKGLPLKFSRLEEPLRYPRARLLWTIWSAWPSN